VCGGNGGVLMASGMLDVGAMPGRIGSWLADHGHRASVVSYELMTGGYSRVMARVGLEWDDGHSEVLVMRGDPPPDLAMLATDRDAEWAMLSCLTTLGHVPVPPVRWYVSDPRWFGTKAMFVDHVSSRTLQAHLDAGLDHADAGAGFSALLASVASVTPEQLPDVERPTAWDAYIDTQIDRWRFLADTYVEALPIVTYLAAWMDTHRPPPMPLRLVHGDPQAANVLVADDGSWRLVDWEFARIGDPREDLGYYNAYSGAVPPNLLGEDVEGFLARYRQLTGFDEDVVNPATLGWFTTLSTISVVQGMHDAIAGLARGTRSGTLVAFNSLMCTVGYHQFLGAIEQLEASLAAAGGGS
jgi:aminoglycoside phosphotransferase (APT) family kinase protein